jgi:Protein of unknown function (DUF4087)
VQTPASHQIATRSLVLLALATFGLCGTVPVAADEKQPTPITRCGWFENPTPGNAWLTDKEGQWIVGTQGGHQAEGDWPDFNGKNWVSTNRSYGYGCACMRVIADSTSNEVQRIISSNVRPLRACRQDPSLPKPEA